MAVTVIASAEEPIRNDQRRRAVGMKWLALKYAAGGELTVGSPFEWVPGVNRCIHVAGTWGTGGHLKLQGSNLASPNAAEAAATLTDWFLLTNPQGTVIDFSANGGAEVTETPRHIRPVITAGDGTTSLNVYVVTVRSGGA